MLEVLHMHAPYQSRHCTVRKAQLRLTVDNIAQHVALGRACQWRVLDPAHGSQVAVGLHLQVGALWHVQGGGQLLYLAGLGCAKQKAHLTSVHCPF